MFGWFRKRDRDQAEAARVPVTAAQADAPATATMPSQSSAPMDSVPTRQAEPLAAAPQLGHEPGRPETERGGHELAPAAPSIVLAAPTRSPSMPLSRHANIAGLAEVAELDPPRLLSPTAALGDEAREMLTELLGDMFGARGRYRLEWRADREPGDDAMFSEIMVNDLVRRIQNTLAEVAEAPELMRVASRPALETGETAVAPSDADADVNADADVDEGASVEETPAASSLAPEASVDRSLAEDDLAEDVPAPADDAERQQAIEAFLAPAETDEQLSAALTPDVAPATERRIA